MHAEKVTYYRIFSHLQH